MVTSRIFRGWWVLLGIFLSYTALVGIQVYTLPLFYPVLIREYGWSSEEVTRAATIFFLTGALITPFISSLYDRYSVRKFMVAGALLTIIGLGCYSVMQSVTHMVFIYLGLALSQVCSGQVPTMVVVTRWFKRKRGIAVGITLLATSVGGAIFPLVVREVMADGSWRDAVQVLMLLSGVMMVLPLIFLIRNRPEDYGLLPDGDSVAAGDADAAVKEGTTLREALRMPAFWMLAFATGALWFCINGIIQHQTIFISTEMGLSMEILPVIISIFFWFAVSGKLLFGWLSDHYSKTLIMFIAVLNLILGLLILRFASIENMYSLYAYAAVYGIGFAGTFTMIQLVIAEFFAGRSYGRILGILTMFDVGSGGLGITVIAKLQAHYGSYLPVIEKLILLCCAVAVIVYLLHRMHSRMPKPSVQAVAAGT